MTALHKLKEYDQGAWNKYMWMKKKEQREETVSWLAKLVGQDIASQFAEIIAFAFVNDHESADLIAIRFDMDKKEIYAFLEDDTLFEKELENDVFNQFENSYEYLEEWEG